MNIFEDMVTRDLKTIDKNLKAEYHVYNGVKTLDIFLVNDDTNSICSFILDDNKWVCSFYSSSFKKLIIEIFSMVQEKYFTISNYDDIYKDIEDNTVNSDDENLYHPKRYHTKSGKQLLDLLREDLMSDYEYVGFLKGNVYKYIFRYQLKNGKEDLKKAQFYLKELIKYVH